MVDAHRVRDEGGSIIEWLLLFIGLGLGLGLGSGHIIYSLKSIVDHVVEQAVRYPR